MMRCLTGLFVFGFIPAIATGQPQSVWLPVDQAVADLDRLSTGLRQVSRGLRIDGEHTSLYQLIPLRTSAAESNPHTPAVAPVLYRIGPGFQARVDRINYLVQTGRRQVGANVQPIADGQFLEQVAANTVFVLKPLPDRRRPPLAPTSDHRIDARLHGRIEARVDARVRGESRSSPAIVGP